MFTRCEIFRIINHIRECIAAKGGGLQPIVTLSDVTGKQRDRIEIQKCPVGFPAWTAHHDMHFPVVDENRVPRPEREDFVLHQKKPLPRITVPELQAIVNVRRNIRNFASYIHVHRRYRKLRR